MNRGPRRVVVANPGSVPEVAAAAAGLAHAGLLDRYCTPFALRAGHLRAVGRALPETLARRLVPELQRRTLPPDVAAGRVQRLGTVSGLAQVLAGRAPVPTSVRARAMRDHWLSFDSSVARSLGNGDKAVMAVAGAAQATLERAASLNARSILDCPTAHHRHVLTVLREEARRVPSYASTLPALAPLEAIVPRLDEELALADLVLTLSSAQTETFVLAGVERHKLVQIPPGVDLALFSPGQRPADRTFRILFVGQLTQRKGIAYLVEAFRQAAIPGSELVLAGALQGHPVPWAGLAGVRSIGPLPQARLPELYRTADVFVMPSLVEGSCLTALEAMACGLPVIVSEQTGTGDLVCDGRQGFVVPIRDSEAIAERLRALYADPDRRASYGLAARRRVEDFGWDVYGRRVADVVAGT